MISLGGNCSVAYNLEKYNYKTIEGNLNDSK